MRPTKTTTNDLLSALRLYGKAQARRPDGLGWYTMDELAALDNVSRQVMRYRLKTAQRNGVQVETATGSVLDADGNAKRATYYKIRGTP